MTTTLVLSKPIAADLIVYRGDSGSFRVTVTDADGAPVDVTAAVWRCEIRAKVDDAVIVELPVVATDGDPSSVDVTVSAEDSALLSANAVWDLEMTEAARVTTLLAGKVVVTRDVSHV
jgi:hypothetical protein